MTRFNDIDSRADIQFTHEFDDLTKIEDPLNIRIIDLIENKEFSFRQIDCEVISVGKNSFSIQFGSQVDILKGEILIDKSSSLVLQFKDVCIWNRYPISVPDVSFISGNRAIAVTTTTIATVNSLRTPVTILISIASPAAATFLDSLISILYLLKLIEGPGVSYPDVILDADMDFQIIPIQIDNPFVSWIDRGDTCMPSKQFIKHELSCNLLKNEGVTYIEVLCLLAITLLITAILGCLIKHLKREAQRLEKDISMPDPGSPATIVSAKRYSKAKIVERVDEIVGLQLFFVKLEGNQLQLIAESMLSIKYSGGYSADIVSLILSEVIIVYYGVVVYYSVRNANYVWKRFKQIHKDNGTNKIKGTLSDHIDLSKLPSPLLAYCFEDFKVPTHFWKLLSQPVTFLYTFIVCAAVIFIIGMPGLQLGVTMTATVGIFFFELLSNIRHSRLEQYSIVAMYFLAIVYMLLKSITLSDGITDSTRQYNLGIPMAGISAALIATSVLFAVLVIGLMIFQVAKYITKMCRKRSTIHNKRLPLEIGNPRNLVSNPATFKRNSLGLQIANESSNFHGLSKSTKIPGYANRILPLTIRDSLSIRYIYTHKSL